MIQSDQLSVYILFYDDNTDRQPLYHMMFETQQGAEEWIERHWENVYAFPKSGARVMRFVEAPEPEK